MDQMNNVSSLKLAGGIVCFLRNSNSDTVVILRIMLQSFYFSTSNWLFSPLYETFQYFNQFSSFKVDPMQTHFENNVILFPKVSTHFYVHG